LATWLESNQAKSLSKMKAEKRLLSYFFIKDASDNFVSKYVKYGRISKDMVDLKK